jgi:hypothetical protein
MLFMDLVKFPFALDRLVLSEMSTFCRFFTKILKFSLRGTKVVQSVALEFLLRTRRAKSLIVTLRVRAPHWSDFRPHQYDFRPYNSHFRPALTPPLTYVLQVFISRGFPWKETGANRFPTSLKTEKNGLESIQTFGESIQTFGDFSRLLVRET